MAICFFSTISDSIVKCLLLHNLMYRLHNLLMLLSVINIIKTLTCVRFVIVG